jgi:hypothetical protein
MKGDEIAAITRSRPGQNGNGDNGSNGNDNATGNGRKSIYRGHTQNNLFLKIKKNR